MKKLDDEGASSQLQHACLHVNKYSPRVDAQSNWMKSDRLTFLDNIPLVVLLDLIRTSPIIECLGSVRSTLQKKLPFKTTPKGSNDELN